MGLGTGGAPFQASKEDFLTTRMDYLVDLIRKTAVNWPRKNSLWPMPFATACCGIELMATGAPRYDIARFGAEVFRFSPRQCDLLICAGRVVIKMMPVLQRLYLQMSEPKWVISMGACASTGGVFDTYSVGLSSPSGDSARRGDGPAADHPEGRVEEQQGARRRTRHRDRADGPGRYRRGSRQVA